MAGAGFSALARDEREADCNVFLTLEGGVAGGGGGTSAIELEFRVRGGEWRTDFWSSTPDFCRSHQWGETAGMRVAGGERTLSVEVTVDDDPYFPGGKGAYEIRVREEDGVFVGGYRGQFNGRDVSGKVTGRRGPVWPGVVEGHVPLSPGEHPRLIFRRGDLPGLKERADRTPEGRAIMEQFFRLLDRGTPLERGRAFPGENVFGGLAPALRAEGAGGAAAADEAEPVQPQKENDKFSSWPAVGYGFAWQMTGERRHAGTARAIVERVFFGGDRMGGQDIHHGPRLQGLALCYDLCFDAWDEAFRRKVADEILLRVQELYAGKAGLKARMSGLNPVWWSNHNGIRSSSAGVGAIAVTGDPGSDGRPMDTRRYADYAMRAARGWFEKGTGHSGWFIEGEFYKTMTFRRGLGHFLQACEVARGERVTTPGTADFFLTGWLMEAEPGYVLPGHDDLLWETILTSGLITVPPGQMPGVKWIFDRTLGLEGNRSFGVNYAMIAPYALTRYPFGVEARPPRSGATHGPAEALPWFAPDVRKGHWVFRPSYRFRDAKDLLLVVNLNSEPLRSCHYERMGTMMGMTLHGLGVRWTEGPFMPRVHGMLNMTQHAGATVRSWRESPERVVTLEIDMDRAYCVEAGRDVEKEMEAEGGVGAFAVPQWATMIDRGVRARRSMAVDAGGACGSPLLIAVADRIWFAPGSKRKGRFGLPLPVAPGLPVAMAGDRFVVGEKAGSTLSGVMLGGTVSAASPILVMRSAAGRGEGLVVMTLQEGAPPEIRVTGAGLAATVTIGRRTVRCVDGSLVLE